MNAWSFPASYFVLLAGALALGYLMGSVPFGLLLARGAGLGDVRAIGSGNIGATNVLRTGRKGLAAATLLLDLLKGTAAVLVADRLFRLAGAAGLVAGFGAFLGHLYPVWLKFNGGKGAATYIGVALGLFWPLALVFGGIWLAVAAASRYSSLASLSAGLIVPVVAFSVFQRAEIALVLGLMTLLIFLRHRTNIRRLLRGQESKIGART
ncbi:MAG: glycerol-3-phosphate 1-O-acyltransferase PlsY [Hyphomicrobiaceae bacterium]